MLKELLEKIIEETSNTSSLLYGEAWKYSMEELLSEFDEELEPEDDDDDEDADGEVISGPKVYEPGSLSEAISKAMNWPVECLKQHGGEGKGDTIYAVYKLNDECVKIHGWYASHVGCEAEGVKDVFPVQKTITVYQTKKEMKDENV